VSADRNAAAEYGQLPVADCYQSARLKLVTKDEPVLEFGLRRAQGIDGGLTASRAAYIGGCDATSNVLAGRIYGIPVRGTHAHSWVMSFDSEEEAFGTYAEVLPNNTVFLVDTFNTLKGSERQSASAISSGKKGYKLGGIRLDSGDLAYFSIEARKMLDEADFRRPTSGQQRPRRTIIASLKTRARGSTSGAWAPNW
jgi:nicotinate phosphoribosyltransferase